MKVFLLSFLVGLALGYGDLIYDVTITKGDREKCIEQLPPPDVFASKSMVEEYYTSLSVCKFNLYNEVIDGVQFLGYNSELFDAGSTFCVEPNIFLENEFCVSLTDIGSYIASEAADATLAQAHDLLVNIHTAADTLREYIDFVSREYTIVAYDNREFAVSKKDTIRVEKEIVIGEFTIPEGFEHIFRDREYFILDDEGVVDYRRIILSDLLLSRVRDFIEGYVDGDTESDDDTDDTDDDDTDTDGSIVAPVVVPAGSDLVGVKGGDNGYNDPDVVHVIIGQNAMYSAVVLGVVFVFLLTLCVLACKVCNLKTDSVHPKYAKVSFDSSSETDALA